MHNILVYLHIIHLLKIESSFLTGAQDSHLQRVTIPEAAYIQLRRRPQDEQRNARNMERILINVLYENKQEFCASSWRSTKVILWCTVNQSSRSSIVYSSTDHIFHDSISRTPLRDNLDEITYSSCQKYVSDTELRIFLNIRLDWKIARKNYENMLMDFAIQPFLQSEMLLNFTYAHY